MHKDENSVIRAIADLVQIEDERLAQEEARSAREQAERAEELARKRAERAEADARQRAEQEHARRVAEAEARMRVEAAQKKQAAQKRIASLQAELAAVQAARDHLARQIGTLESDGIEPAGKRGYAWPLAFSTIGIAVAAVILVLVVPEPPPANEGAGATTNEIGPETPPYPVAGETADATPPETANPNVGEPDVTTPGHVETATALEPKRERDRSGARGPASKLNGKKKQPKAHRKGKGTAPHKTKEEGMSLEKCGDDPMCGILHNPRD